MRCNIWMGFNFFNSKIVSICRIEKSQERAAMSGWGRGGQRHLLATAFLFWHLAAVGWAASWSLAKGPPIRNSPQHVAISAKLGGQVRITCPVHSDPEPIVEWYRVRSTISWISWISWMKAEKLMASDCNGRKASESRNTRTATVWANYRSSSNSSSAMTKAPTSARPSTDSEPPTTSSSSWKSNVICIFHFGFLYVSCSLKFKFEIELNVENVKAWRLIFQGSKDNNCRQQDEDEVSRLDDDSGNDFPVISQLRKSEKHLLKPAGSQVSIKCSATGKASLTIRWFKVSHFGDDYLIRPPEAPLGLLEFAKLLHVE